MNKTDLKQIQKIIQKEISPIKNDLKTVKKDVAQVKKDTEAIIKFFDREYLELRRRIERIEEYLNLPPITPQ